MVADTIFLRLDPKYISFQFNRDNTFHKPSTKNDAYQTRKTVFQRDIQTPGKELKLRREIRGV